MRHTPLSRVTGIALALALATAAPAVALADEVQAGAQADPVMGTVVETIDASQEQAGQESDDKQAVVNGGDEAAASEQGADAQDEFEIVQDESQDEGASESSVAPQDEIVPQDEATPQQETDAAGSDAASAVDEDAGKADDAAKLAQAEAKAGQTDTQATQQTAAKATTTASTAKTTTQKLTAQAEPAKSAAQKKLDELAAKHANDLPAGRYVITSKANPSKSGDKTTYALDVKYGSKKAGAEIILYKVGSGANQRWDISYLKNGYALIKSVASGLYLSLANGASAFTKASIPTIVQQSLVNGAAWQQWIIERLSDGSYKITSGVLNKNGQMVVIDVKGAKAASAVNLIAYKKKSSGDANQRFAGLVTNDILDAEAKSHKSDLKDGTYMIGSSMNASFGLNMAYASVNNGGTVILYKTSSCANEAWVVKHASNGYVTITNLKSGKVLDVKYGKAQAGAGIIQWAANSGARNQQWIAERGSDGTYRFVSALGGSDLRLVLSVTNGKAANCSAISLQKDKGTTAKNEYWKTSGISEPLKYYRALADGTYFIRTTLDLTKVLDVPMSSKADNVQVKLWTAKVGSNNQYWIVSHDKQGYVLFKNKNSGKYLNISTSKVGGLYVANQTTAVGKWVVKSAGNGSFTLTNARTNTDLDLQDGKTANGSIVHSYKAVKNNKNQQWVIGGVGSIKVAIDPGHGSNDSGATGNGLRECDCTWVIANACADKLKSYGFSVYMTVSQSEFKNSGITTPSIKERVQRAKKAGCVAVFSIHINAGGGSGAEVLVPNSSSFHKEYYSLGQSFAKDVTTRIKNAVGIGVHGDGAYERNYSADETGGEVQYYSGGGYADYYGIVRYSREAGMFGVIIEHGFIDNAHDASILKSSANLKKIGEADAAAINAIKSRLG